MKDNLIYLYDGTFLNLISLINHLLKFKIKPLNICDENKYISSLLEEPVRLELEQVKISNMKISSNILKTIYYVFLSEEENKELIIYYFWLNSLKYQNKIFYMRNLKCVSSALKISKYVNNENHKLKGFLRFREINNHILYAEISPTNNVLELLSKHFAKRLKNEYWIIYDIGRNRYSIYDKKRYYIVSKDNINLDNIKLDKEEKDIENLWLTFFETIGIEERKNKRCQMNFMPKKYWKYMIEMESAYEKGDNG
ncbi:putative uncharacterized protein [Mycoplasma sp. CAG:776]|nr:putative uncharacterized protein [Mycoplasma sp. CAG:776]